MLAGILSVALALASLSASLVAAGLWLRGRRALSRAVQPASMVLVLPVTATDNLEPGLLRTLAAADTSVPAVIRIVAGIMDERNPGIARECLARLPAGDIRLDSVAVPSHQVPVAALALAGVQGESAEVTVFLDPRARPASRDAARLAASLGDGYDLAIPCPSPVPGGSIGERLASRSLGDLVPLLRATFGNAGLPCGTAAVRMTALGPVRGDPMACNRPTLGASIVRIIPGGRSVLVPLPVGIAPARAGDIRRETLAHAVRAEPLRAIWLGAALAALPVSMALLLLGAGSWHGLAAISFLVAIAARAIVAGTWSLSVQGAGPALYGLFAAPSRDTKALAALLASACSSTIRIAGVSFRIRKGGILVPMEPMGDSES